MDETKEDVMEEKLTVSEALNLAVKIQNEGRLDEAEAIYKKILEQFPSNPDALHLLGLIAQQKNNHEEAIGLIGRAIEIKHDAIYYNNLGMIYDSINEEEKSAENFKKAIKIEPRHLNAHRAYYNLGVYYMEKGELLKALDYFEKTLELEKEFSDAHWNRSLILLILGGFEEGWKEYEYRFKKKSFDSRADKPKWDGSNLEGKKILIASEQGFGDNIQFARYLPLIENAYVILECKKELRKLFEDSLHANEFIEKADNIDFDFYIPLMSLPYIFKTDLNSIPKNIPYLKADAKLAEKFREKIRGDFKVGIVWAGNPNQANDKNRTMPFEKFRCLEELPISLFSLQKGTSQLNSKKIINMAEFMTDFSDAAAIIENLDLIISVDTSIAHLAGAMGKPVWTLLCYLPDWRWLLDRNDSPWYPSMKLFRQEKAGDWDSVLQKVKKELENLIKKC